MKNIDLGLHKLPYGGDWNPEQWDKSVWEEDVRLFKQAGIDLLSINIFSWTLDQPDEETWHVSNEFEVTHRLTHEGKSFYFFLNHRDSTQRIGLCGKKYIIDLQKNSIPFKPNLKMDEDAFNTIVTLIPSNT